MSTPDLRQALRSETAASHRQLDQRMGDLDLFGSPQHYAAYLALMHSLHLAMADSINCVANHLNLSSNEVLIRSLEQDLDSTGHASLRNQSANATQQNGSDTVRERRSPSAEQWGTAYVIEGSSMGGVFLYRQAQQKLDPYLGSEFLRQLSGHAADRWPRFIEGLRATDIDSDRAITSAKATFRQAEIILEQLLLRLNRSEDEERTHGSSNLSDLGGRH
ncbi:biliverdin-producing heme oxygenase [Roseiconus lacunae]|uniref:biliverdin-producing heme oxygenase n=1 Tax=Roseiconus lacunae TaxID=2605694 RepID=UPI0030928378|nr:biliverdin-producing heme oxygenase [Stieleria sp. HD01]